MTRRGVSVKLSVGDIIASQKSKSTRVRTRFVVSGQLPSP